MMDDKLAALIEGCEFYVRDGSVLKQNNPDKVIRDVLSKERPNKLMLEMITSLYPSLAFVTEQSAYSLDRERFRKLSNAIYNIQDSGFFYIHSNQEGGFHISTRRSIPGYGSSDLISHNDYKMHKVSFIRKE